MSPAAIRFACRILDEPGADCAVLRADRDSDPSRGVGVCLSLAQRLDVSRGVGLERVEVDPLVLLSGLDSGCAEVVKDRLLELGVTATAIARRLLPDRPARVGVPAPVESTALPANASERCGDRLSTVNGPETRTFCLSSWGLS